MSVTRHVSSPGSEVVSEAAIDRGQRASLIEIAVEPPVVVVAAAGHAVADRQVYVGFDGLASTDDARERQLRAAIGQLSPRQCELAERFLRGQKLDEIQRDMEEAASRQSFLSLFRQTVAALTAALGD